MHASINERATGWLQINSLRLITLRAAARGRGEIYRGRPHRFGQECGRVRARKSHKDLGEN